MTTIHRNIFIGRNAGYSYNVQTHRPSGTVLIDATDPNQKILDEAYITGSFPGISDCININSNKESVWFCEYCEVANTEDSMFCGNGLPYGCGAPRYEKEKKK